MLSKESRMRPPALENYSDHPLFNTKAVVRQTGVPAPTLRAWERRYGILAPHRGENDYRLYSERDMATVAWLRERVANGMTISQAIALLHALESARDRGRASRPLAAAAGASLAPVPPEGVDSAVALATLSLPELSRALLAQVTHLEEQAAARTISQALAISSVEEVCLSLLTPVLVTIGRLWAVGEVGVAVEHFATMVIRAQLEGLFRSALGAESGPYVLVGCAPGEQHEVGALMLALFLRRLGLRVLYLGQNVEVESLSAMVAATEAACVLLSAALRPHAEALVGVSQRLSAYRTLLFVGGQAFERDPELARQLPGILIGVSAQEAARDIKRRLSA
ncbi:MAG: cobalamin-dependent protein [Ktedonobacterales bacterium]|nr:cobalamin-dependent protein [Ktedonobacterales bacterium]